MEPHLDSVKRKVNNKWIVCLYILVNWIIFKLSKRLNFDEETNEADIDNDNENKKVVLV